MFSKGKLRVRKLDEKDNVLLAKWLSDPAVLEFYEGRDNPFDLSKVNEVFYSSEDEDVKCIVEFEGNEIGYIQFYQIDGETKKEYGYGNENVYGTDQFIGERGYWGRSIGTLLVSSMIEYLAADKKADLIVMDPQTRNIRAVQCYEKCGLRKVKLLPQRELHEGEYQDCWLMEYRIGL
ncbi:GNAT family N-acetyltransferase [Bacillus salacetis]|uniref:GNAT family N-acetyltransferase n=1 Tax=Bacillus salacetis TaxID=2315464 RepID=A0A3A1R5N3_9BACI|nr:GNAT family N-acetyltransferase [Bacillus salacetis]RIW38350.1 GNAT family N-acetyltransferase [Bacillus salacetis]